VVATLGCPSGVAVVLGSFTNWKHRTEWESPAHLELTVDEDTQKEILKG